MFDKFALRLRDRTLLFQICLLSTLWLVGLIVGVWLAAGVYTVGYLSFVDYATTTPSILVLLIACYAPIILCVIGLLNDFFPINCIVIISESICRGFCGFLIYVLCGSGAWLLRLFFMFSSTFSAVLLWWILFRYFIFGKSCIRKNCCIAGIFIFLLIMVDRLLVSPFLIHLSMYF